MLAPEDVYNAAAIMLQHVVDAAETLGVRLPARRTITAGGAVYDCEMVTFSVTTVILGLPSNQDGRLLPCGPSAWGVIGDIAIVRKAAEHNQGVRGTTPPSPAMLYRDMAQVSTDTAVIATAVNKYGDLTRDVSLSFSVNSPLGGLLATTGNVTIPIWPDEMNLKLPVSFVCPS